MTVNGTTTPLSNRWWTLEDKDEIATNLVQVAHRLRERNRPRRNQQQMFGELYGGTEMAGLGLTTYDVANQVFFAAYQPYNICRSATDTLTAKICKTKPKPTFLTDKGNYKQIKRAKSLEKFMDGLWYQLKLYEHTRWIFRDACIWGTGILAVFRRGDRVYIERIFPWEMMFDIADARYGKPQCLYTIKWIGKDVLADLFPDFEEEIWAARNQEDDLDHVTDYEAQVDRILVTEAWHLPSGPDAEDGRHTVVIDGCTLVWEDYEKHYYPFAILKYKEPLAGFFGNGLVEEMSGFQYEINEVADRVQQAHYLTGGQIWLVPDGADIVDTEISNNIGVIIHHKPGMPPEAINPQPIADATYQYMKDLPNFALKFSGISEMSATSTKPADITAAKAMEMLDDVETERFNGLLTAWEQFHMDICDQCIDLCKEIDEEHPGFSVRAGLKKYGIEIKWSDVDMDRDAFTIQVFPTNLFAKTPAARMQQVTDLFKAQIIDRAMYLRLLDAPDLGGEEDLEAAARTVADEQLEHLVDAEDVDNNPDAMVHPEPFQDLIYALHRAQATYNMGRIQGMPEPNLALLRDYMSECKSLLDMQNPPQPPPTPANVPGALSGAIPMQGMPGQVPAMPGQPMPQPGVPGAQPQMPMPPPGGQPPPQ